MVGMAASGGTLEQLSQLIGTADGRIERVADEQRAEPQAGAQQESCRQDQETIGRYGLFRRQRRLDHREPLALALDLEILGDLHLALLRPKLIVLALGGFQLPGQLAVVALDGRLAREPPVVVFQLRLELDRASPPRSVFSTANASSWPFTWM